MVTTSDSIHQVIRPTQLMDPANIGFSPADQLVLKKLAETYQNYLEQPVEKEKQALQMQKNKLDWVRPLVICFPEVSWREIIPADSLLCEGKLARSWEKQLRQLIFTAEMGSDECLQPGFQLGYMHQGLDWGIGMQQEGDLEHGSYRWELR